jgi:transcription antitermination factor NusG
MHECQIQPFSTSPERETEPMFRRVQAHNTDSEKLETQTVFLVKKMESNDVLWFGIHVKSRCEYRAYDDLNRRGFETFLPLRMEKRRWSDRIATVQTPLFPGYLFCKFSPLDRFRVLNATGVAQIIGSGKAPVPISESEIQSVQTLITSKMFLSPWPYLQVGQLIHIDDGPLAGVEGVVVHAEDGKSRIIVSVTMFLRSVAVEVERDWISYTIDAKTDSTVCGAA